MNAYSAIIRRNLILMAKGVKKSSSVEINLAAGLFFDY